MRNVLIMVAPNGARLGKADAPGVPLTPGELAAEAVACRNAGAAAMHLHVRDEAGRHSLEAAHYREALAAVRAAVGQGMVLQITTEAAGCYRPDAQMQAVRQVRPEAVSIALRELLPEEADTARQREVLAFLQWMHAEGIAPQFILYEAGEVARLARLMKQGALPWARLFVLFVLGRYGGEAASADMLDGFLDAFQPLRQRAAWMACAFGARQLEVLRHVALRGGHVRVGFENGRDIAPGKAARGNAELVAALAKMLREEGLAPMNATHARRLMGVQGS